LTLKRDSKLLWPKTELESKNSSLILTNSEKAQLEKLLSEPASVLSTSNSLRLKFSNCSPNTSKPTVLCATLISATTLTQSFMTVSTLSQSLRTPSLPQTSQTPRWTQFWAFFQPLELKLQTREFSSNHLSKITIEPSLATSLWSNSEEL